MVDDFVLRIQGHRHAPVSLLGQLAALQLQKLVVGHGIQQLAQIIFRFQLVLAGRKANQKAAEH